MVLAQDSPVEVTLEPPSPKRRSRVAWLVAAVAAAGFCAVVWVATVRNEPGPVSADAGSAPGAVAPGPAIQPPDTSEQTVGAGWVRYGGAPAQPSGSTPQDAWIERPTLGSSTLAALRDGAERLEVRDQPGGGSIVGYDYVGLGFVSLAEAPGFDARAARVSRYGCDFLLDPVCAATLTEQGPGASGPVPPARP
jgi:hypothetical protein